MRKKYPLQVVQRLRWGILHQIWSHRSWKNSTGCLADFLPSEDCLECRYYPCFFSGWDLTALSPGFPKVSVEDFMIVPLVSLSGKNWLQISTLFTFSYIIHSKSLPTFWSLDDYLSSLLTQCLVFRFFLIFFIFRSLSFLHISCVPVLSSFKDVFFEFHYLVTVFLSRIKLIVPGFVLSRFCGSETWSLHAIPTDPSCCQFMPPKIVP